MKKRITVITAALMLVLLGGCGVTRVSVRDIQPESTVVRVAKAENNASLLLNYSAEDSRKMSNYMLANRFAHIGKTLYGSRHDETGTPYLCKMKFTAGQSGMYVRETNIIETKCDAQYLTIADNMLYYIKEDCTDGKKTIEKLPCAENAGTVPETVYSGQCDFLQISGGRLYFTDERAHLISIKPDGTDVQAVIADKAVYYPYFVSENMVMYQDEAAGESLKMRYLPTGFEITVAQGRVFSYVVSGGYIYYLRCAESEGEKCRLCRTDVNAFLKDFNPVDRPDAAFMFKEEQAAEFMGPLFSINGDHINASNYKAGPVSAWQSISDDAWEKGYTAACQYVSEDFEIFYDYNAEGLISKMLFYEPALKRAGYIEVYNYG